MEAQRIHDLDRRLRVLEAIVNSLVEMNLLSATEMPLTKASAVLGYGTKKTDHQTLRRLIGSHYRVGVEVFDKSKSGTQRPRWFFNIPACLVRDKEVVSKWIES